MPVISKQKEISNTFMSDLIKTKKKLRLLMKLGWLACIFILPFLYIRFFNISFQHKTLCPPPSQPSSGNKVRISCSSCYKRVKSKKVADFKRLN